MGDVADLLLGIDRVQCEGVITADQCRRPRNLIFLQILAFVLDDGSGVIQFFLRQHASLRCRELHGEPFRVTRLHALYGVIIDLLELIFSAGCANPKCLAIAKVGEGRPDDLWIQPRIHVGVFVHDDCRQSKAPECIRRLSAQEVYLLSVRQIAAELRFVEANTWNIAGVLPQHGPANSFCARVGGGDHCADSVLAGAGQYFLQQPVDGHDRFAKTSMTDSDGKAPLLFVKLPL